VNLKTLIKEAKLSGIYNAEANGAEQSVYAQEATTQQVYAIGGLKT
jgi:hypothetical protein